MTAKPTTQITAKDSAHIAQSVERLVESEARRLQSRGLYPQTDAGLRLAHLEVALTIDAVDAVERAVANAKASGATWDEIAGVVGLSSRGSAARRFGSVRVSENETSEAANIAHSPTKGTIKLNAAQTAKKDEFYTRVHDIEREMEHYVEQFRGRSIFLNCDRTDSGFWRYFSANFDRFGLRKLTSVGYAPGGRAVKASLDNGGFSASVLDGDGDFRSQESLALLDEHDLVITNPPFSLFRDFVATLVEHEKDFIILGNSNSITYQEVWGLIQSGSVWLGATSLNGTLFFYVPDDFVYSPAYRFAREIDGRKACRVPGVCWFTTLDHDRRHEGVALVARYADDPSKYPRYDNLDAIDVSKVADIPADYFEPMGVPITFLGKHDPTQFRILGAFSSGALAEAVGATRTFRQGDARYWNGPTINEKSLYARVVIQRVQPDEPLARAGVER